MRKLKTLLFLSFTLLALTANAGLILRTVDGINMVYDQHQDITWLLEPVYIPTDEFTNTLRKSWGNANRWAQSLHLGGFDDWRLPLVRNTDALGNDLLNYQLSLTGGTDRGYNVDVDNSELAYLYYVLLGNKAYCAPSNVVGGSCTVQKGYDDVNLSFTDAETNELVTFQNVATGTYWLDGDYPNANNSWSFGVGIGYQREYSSANNRFNAWAVRDGDVLSVTRVAEPSTLATVIGSLIILMSLRSFRRSKIID